MRDLQRDIQFIQCYIKIAKEVALLSHAKKRKVGAVIVKEGNIIAFSYNGTPKGMPNNCEDANGITYPYVIHAEANAIIKAGTSTQGAVLYQTFSPCYQCAKLIIQAGIKSVVWYDTHSDETGIALLKDNGINVAQLRTIPKNGCWLLFEDFKREGDAFADA